MNTTIQAIRSVEKAQGKSELEKLAAQHNEAVGAKKDEEQKLARAIECRDGWARNVIIHEDAVRDLAAKLEKIARGINRALDKGQAQ